MREWIKLYPKILRSRKWRVLDPEDRLAWIVLMLESVPDEGVIEDTDSAEWLLRREGFSTPGATVATLVSVGALDETDRGLEIRRWSRWQKQYRGPSDDPELKAARERERYWRSQVEALRGESGTSLGEPGIEEKREEEIREENPPRVPPSQTPEGDRDSQDRFYEITMLRPWGKDSGRWLLELDAGYGVERVSEALDEAWRNSQDRKTLISRAEAILARSAEKARRNRPKPKVSTNGVDPEVANRQRQEFARMVGHGPGRSGKLEKIGGQG